MQETVCQIVRDMEQDYVNGNTTISKYVDRDMYETLNKIDAYLHSVHTTGSTDSLGRDKPFFNIVTATRNIWFRATDIDRKNIKLKATKFNQYVLAFVAQILLKKWMRKTGFGAFLNDWGMTLATYCSAVSKFVEKNGELIPSVIAWNRIICDPIDFDSNAKIEVLEFTPAQLRKQKGYDQDMVKSLLEDLAPREDLNKQKKDNKSGYIKVYEVHGELPLSLLTDDEKDEDTYVQQMHVVSFVAKSKRKNTEFEDYTLYKGREKKNPYFISHLIKEDGQTLGIGSVESLFDAQWMTNHTAKQIKDTLDFASLLILQTSDGSLVGRNVLNSLVTGDVLIHAENQPLTQLNNQHDISQIQAFSSQWQNLAKEITSTPDALRGNTQPSGTAYRLQQLITNQSQSLFEIMTENKGLAIEAMLREYVIPFLKTQMDTSDEVAAVLDSEGIAQFDAMYIPSEAIRRNNNRIIEQVLSGQIAEQGDLQAVESGIRQELSPYGNQRFIKPSDIEDVTWKKLLKDFEWEPDIDVTQESEDVQDALTTLQSTFQTIVSLAGRPMTPDEKLVFNQIMEKAGTVSPLQLNQTPTMPPQQPQQPVTGGSTAVKQPALAGAT
jgi:hypothetical protein